MHAARYFLASLFFLPAALLLYGIWLNVTPTPGSFTDLVGVILIGIAVLAIVLCAVALMVYRSLRDRMPSWWVGVLTSIACLFVSLFGIVLLSRF